METRNLLSDRMYPHHTVAVEEESDTSKTALNVLREIRVNLTSRISHGIRTPLTAILGFSELLLEDPTLPKEDREEFFRIIRNETERLIQFISALHDYEDLRTGRLQLEHSGADFVATVQGAVSAAAAQMSGNDSRISVTARPMAIHLSADHRRLGIVLERLLTLAARSIPSGRPMRMQVEESERKITLRLHSEASLPPYDAADAASTLGVPGSDHSLDLAIARGIVELHRGTLTVNPGHSPVFEVALPSTSV